MYTWGGHDIIIMYYMKDYDNCMSTKYGSGRFCFFKNLFCSALLLFKLPYFAPKIPYSAQNSAQVKKNFFNDYCTASYQIEVFMKPVNSEFGWIQKRHSK